MSEPAAAHPARHVRRLVLCFDGTWNTLDSNTNVARIYGAIGNEASGCASQLTFYDPGVGTTEETHLAGGFLGWGLDQNILEGYSWLINRYFAQTQRDERGEPFDDGPDIFILGFSRGAYTARSLGGLMNRCGIPRREQFAGEPHGLAHANAPLVREAWDLYRRKFPTEVEARYEQPCVDFRARHSWNPKIKFIGVWDTVGALGVPMLSSTVLARVKYGFHDTSLGRIVENAFHAVAIDEQREDYAATLWTKKRDGQNVEQRWFPGAHANVGGGYPVDPLPHAPLKWIAERAIDAGLEFTDSIKVHLGLFPLCTNALPSEFKLRGDEYKSPVCDSYAQFMYGAYRFFRTIIFKGRYDRPMLEQGVAETIDETARLKWKDDATYRPKNLARALETHTPE